jgi:hypothetical protein
MVSFDATSATEPDVCQAVMNSFGVARGFEGEAGACVGFL